jgi:NAD(P)-dependent dehydrogenase (short-subunit alcohol dehydrogenase family)
VAGSFQDEVVLVTGAAGQIGAGCVEAFAREGAKVAAVDVQPMAASAHVLPVVEDLSDEGGIQRAFAAAEATLGPVSILVQSAAVYAGVPYLDITGRNIDHILAVNVRTVLLAGRVAARSMIAHDITGAIVNITSTSSLLAEGISVGYEASKGAVTSATRGMAIALAPYGIRVNAVAPGSMVKDQESAVTRQPSELDSYEEQRIPLGRLGVPSEIADAVMFLASPASRYITGTVLYVDGGALAAWKAARR